MDVLDQLLKNISKEAGLFFLEKKEIVIDDINLERPADLAFGDFFTNVALRYAKQVKQSPMDLSKELVEYLQARSLIGVSNITVVAPGFINFYLKGDFLSLYLKQVLALGDQFGENSDFAGQKWVIEHTSPNPNKAMHLGHLRNNLVGMGIVRLIKAGGAEVVSDAVYNDRGIAIAKLMYGFLIKMKKNPDQKASLSEWLADPSGWFSPQEKSIKPDLFVTECYVAGEDWFRQSPNNEQIVRDLVISWEKGDQGVWKLWSLVLEYAYEGINRTLSRLGSYWDKVWYEHEHYQKGKDYVLAGLESGKFIKLEDGAVITNLEADYGLPDTVLLKKDETSLYITQDIALTALKKDFYQANKLVWVIGPEQSLAMKQLFAVSEQLGIGELGDFTHVTYGYVGLRGDGGEFKKMSSRAGTVILIDDVIDDVKSRLSLAIESGSTDDASLEKLALSAVKFSILKSDRVVDLVFDPESSISVNGDSGVYLLYTLARINSVLNKAKSKADIDSKIALSERHPLLQVLLYFPQVVKHSQASLSVHHIAQYLLELASLFNSWYAKETILDGTPEEGVKLAIAQAVSITLKKGLGLLGIETVEKV